MGFSASEIILVSVSQSITIIGKAWLMVMLFLRLLLLLVAGFPLYQDEQERFVCNTIQPGCANVCYDIYSPVSLFRFWLLQLVALCVPTALFIIYVSHKVTDSLQIDPHTAQLHVRRLGTSFSGAYVLQLLLRTVLEAGFGAAHYYLFGFYVPRRFLCQHTPCTTQVDCYISRPTEKTLMLNFMLGVGALSVVLNVLDFVCAVKRSVRHKQKLKLEAVYEEECVVSDQKDANATESFRRRHGSRSSRDAVGLESRPCLPVIQATNENNGNNGNAIQEDVLERQGSEVALCPGTPRSIRVSKRGRVKPPPPPRRDQVESGPAGGPDGAAAAAAAVAAAAAACHRKLKSSLVELSTGSELQPKDEEKKSEWV
ncbi:unnamed protein product [Knipowitschia caucasica]|uniref:Gap junction protein n=1 Tax=Knipowitschia caucasica TaxID=637954 RepID=A0AAV2KBV9_KNICA